MLQMDSIFIGFDSAWADNPKAPGAVCSIAFDREAKPTFTQPRLASFDQALKFIAEVRQGFSHCLVSIDQPTIVPNMKGGRPVERVAASVISFVGGGVQPANRSKTSMFGDDAPVWRFKQTLGAVEDPEVSRVAQSGIFLIEVFPALALSGMNSAFSQRLSAPKYNPTSSKFRIQDWKGVADTVADIATKFGLADLSSWALELGQLSKPRKADQDRLDAAICALVGLMWRSFGRDRVAMIGDTQKGYMVTPVSPETQLRLRTSALSKDVPYH